MRRSGCIWEVTPRSTGGGRKKAGGQAGEAERAGPTEQPPGTQGASTDPKPVSMHTLGRRPCWLVSFAGRRHLLPSTSACPTGDHVHSAAQKQTKHSEL